MSDSNDDKELAALHSLSVPHKLDYIGLGAGLVPFVLTFRQSRSESTSMTTIDASGKSHTTVKESAKFFDPVALAGGIVALAIALVLLAQVRQVEPQKRALRAGLAVVILGLGGYQLAVRSGILT